MLEPDYKRQAGSLCRDISTMANATKLYFVAEQITQTPPA